MGVSVSVDPEYCVGTGDCVRLVPDAFELDEDEAVSRPLPGAEDAPLELLLRAAQNCPTQAIRVVGPDGAVLHDSNG